MKDRSPSRRDARFGTYQLLAGTGKAVPVATGPIAGGSATIGSPDIATTTKTTFRVK
jgi:hypothetical protein